MRSDFSMRSSSKRAIAHSVQLQPDQNIFADRHGRERIRFLEHHSDAAADDGRIYFARIKILRRETRRFLPRVCAARVRACG